VSQHSIAVGHDAGEQPEGLNGLEHGHAAAIEGAGAERPGTPEKLGLERKVDDLGHPEIGTQQIRRGGAGPDARSCRQGWC
jgi:hypothetical protein